MCTKRSLLATLIVINPYLPINVAPLSPAPAMALDLDALRATEKQTINLFEVGQSGGPEGTSLGAFSRF